MPTERVFELPVSLLEANFGLVVRLTDEQSNVLGTNVIIVAKFDRMARP